MENKKISPFDKVNLDGVSPEEREKLSDPNYTTGKMEVKKEKTFGSKPESKNPTNKMYIVFIVSDIGEHYCSYIGTSLTVNGEFGICNGREDAYEYIKKLLSEDDDGERYLDIEASTVLVEGVSCTERVSWYRFMKYCEEFYPDDDFNIDDYLFDDDLEEKNYDSVIETTGNGKSSIANMIINNLNKSENKEEK